MRQRLAYISESQKIIEELENKIVSIKSFKKKNVSFYPIVKDESHGESFLPLLGVRIESKSGSVKKKQRSLEMLLSCLFPLLESTKRATSMK
jgi:hypothetical protein